MRRGSFVRAQILFALHGIERRLPDPGTCRPALVCRADYHALLNYVSQTSKKDLVRLSVYSAKEFHFWYQRTMVVCSGVDMSLGDLTAGKAIT